MPHLPQRKRHSQSQRKLWGFSSIVLVGLFLGIPQDLMSTHTVSGVILMLEQASPQVTDYLNSHSSVSGLNGALASLTIYLISRMRQVRSPLPSMLTFLLADAIGNNVSLTWFLAAVTFVSLIISITHGKLGLKSPKNGLDHFI